MPPLVAGIGIGVPTFVHVDQRVVIALIGAVTVGFAARWIAGGEDAGAVRRAPSLPRAAFRGGLSGFATFVAHSGGPPLAIYLLPQRLGKTVYAGTTVLFWSLLAIAPVVPLGVWTGRVLHTRVSDRALYRIYHVLLLASGAKLLADGFIALLG